jgi:hypothetical protein
MPLFGTSVRKSEGVHHMADGFLSSSWRFINLAWSAAQRSSNEYALNETARSSDPLVSIVFSAAACEAFISELAEFAGIAANEHEGRIPPEPGSVLMFKALYDEVEASKGSLKSKYILGFGLFSERPINKGVAPYQDFALLLDLRNSLVHIKLDKIMLDDTKTALMKYPPIVEKLRSRGVLAPLPGPNVMISWVSVVSTPATARWCVRSAASVIVGLISVIPEGRVKHAMDLFYLEEFNTLTSA